MKVSNKQQQEIDFMIEHFVHGDKKVSDEDKMQYITSTVYGKVKINKGGMGGDKVNALFDAKRNLDISIKMWQKDLVNGLLGINELHEEFGGSDYGKKLVDSIFKGLNFSKRQKGEGDVGITMVNSLIRQEKFGLKFHQ